MDTVRLAFVGLGGMGQCAHLRNYSILPDVQVVAAAEIRPELGRMVAQRYNIPRLYKDHNELLAKEKQIDGIVAIQQFGMHGQLVPELLAAGVPVITEKPLAKNIEAGEKILAAAQKSKGKLYLAYHKRSDPATMFAVQKIEQWKASKQFGAMKYVRVSMPPGKWDMSGFSTLIKSSDPYPKLVSDPDPAGANPEDVKQYIAFVNYYIHQVNLMRHLMRENYRVKYSDAAGVTMATRSDSGVSGLLEMASYQNSLDWQESALVAFEKAWIRIDLPAPLVVDQPGRVTIYEDAGGGATPMTLSPTLPPVHAMWQQAKNFIAAIRGEKTCLCEAAEGLEDLCVARQYLDLRHKAEAELKA